MPSLSTRLSRELAVVESGERRLGGADDPGYEIEAVLGRGGMGIVYRARQTKLNRVVALKMILAGEHAGHEASVRFLSEAETIAKLRHPNIVQIYSFGDHDERPYLELEYLEGGSLSQKLDGTPWAPSGRHR